MAKYKIGGETEVVWTPSGDFDPITFGVGALDFVGLFAISELAEQDETNFSPKTVQAMVDFAVKHVLRWKGVEAPNSEDEAECTEELKKMFFSQQLGATLAIFNSVTSDLRIRAEMGKVSGAGSASPSVTPTLEPDPNLKAPTPDPA